MLGFLSILINKFKLIKIWRIRRSSSEFPLVSWFPRWWIELKANTLQLSAPPSTKVWQMFQMSRIDLAEHWAYFHDAGRCNAAAVTQLENMTLLCDAQLRRPHLLVTRSLGIGGIHSFLCGSLYNIYFAMIWCKYLNISIIWSIVNRLQSFLSFGHLVIQSFGYSVIGLFGHSAIRSFGH